MATWKARFRLHVCCNYKKVSIRLKLAARAVLSGFEIVLRVVTKDIAKRRPWFGSSHGFRWTARGDGPRLRNRSSRSIESIEFSRSRVSRERRLKLTKSIESTGKNQNRVSR